MFDTTITRQLESTALTLLFNSLVGDICRNVGIPYLDDRVASRGADGMVKLNWINGNADNQHYNRSVYARWLAKQLKNILNPKVKSA